MTLNNHKTLIFFQKASFTIVLLIVLLLPLYINFGMRILLVLLVLTYLIEITIEERWKDTRIKGNKYVLFYLSILFYFLLQFLYLPFEKNMLYFFQITEERLSFLVIGLIGLIGLNSYFKLKHFAWTYIIASLLYCIFLLAHINREMILNNDVFNQLGLIRIKYLNSHMKFNFYLNASFVFVYYLLQSYKQQKKIWLKIFLYTSGFIILLNLWLSEGRTGALTSIILLIMIFLHFMWGKNKFIAITLISVSCITFSIFILQNSRFNMDKIKNEPRIQIWEVSLNELKESKLIGEGASTAWYNLNENLLASGLGPMKHAHNILLQTTIEYGLIGFINIILIFLSAYFAISKRYRFIMLLILLAAFFQLMFGSFMRDVEPLSFLLPILLLFHQDSIDEKNDSLIVDGNVA